MTTNITVTVVGIGAGGVADLAPQALQILREAGSIVGSPRQLDLLGDLVDPGLRVELPKPLRAGLGELLPTLATPVVVLASGDPMVHGIGSTLVDLLGADAVHVVPNLSSVTLACARMRWALEDVDVVSLVSRPVQTINPWVVPGRRLLVLSRDATTPRAVADVLSQRGFETSPMTVLSKLGAPDEARLDRTAAELGAGNEADLAVENLNVVAVQCIASPWATVLPRLAGLPDEVFENDGQLTKREVRAVTMAHLMPSAGQLLWDVGAGAGSIAIEWMRYHDDCRAIAVDAREDRLDRMRRNAALLGVPEVATALGEAPEALADLPTPDAVFIGGGLNDPGVFETCWQALRPGGRMVANAVTLESEARLTELYQRHGGDLVKVSVSRAVPVGTMLGLRPSMAVTVWSTTKPATAAPVSKDEA